MSAPIDTQIRDAVRLYVRREVLALPIRKAQREVIAKALTAAMLSGISLTSRFLAANDGSDAITPQAIERACAAVAAEFGFSPERL